MKYEELNWESLELIEAHLRRRVAEPLGKLLEGFEAAQRVNDKGAPAEKLIASQQTTAALLNTLKAWSALIAYKRKASAGETTLQVINKAHIPPWLNATLDQKTNLRLEFTRSITSYPETLWEGLLLLYEVAAHISQVAYIQFADALAPKQGVYLRVVFSSKAEMPPFTSIEDILRHFDPAKPDEQIMATQLHIARDMMLMNNAKFTLQNNKKTGQQAFAVYFEAAELTSETTDHELPFIAAPIPSDTAVPPASAVISAEISLPQPAEKTPAEQPTPLSAPFNRPLPPDLEVTFIQAADPALSSDAVASPPNSDQSAKEEITPSRPPANR